MVFQMGTTYMGGEGGGLVDSFTQGQYSDNIGGDSYRGYLRILQDLRYKEISWGWGGQTISFWNVNLVHLTIIQREIEGEREREREENV